MTFSDMNDDSSEKKARSRRLESELLILQSDKKRLEGKREAIVTDLRGIKNEMSRLKLDIDAKERADQDLSRQITVLEGEIARVRRQINLI